MNKRSKSRITKYGLIYERRLIALRRLQAQRPRGIETRPTESEIQNAEERWFNLKRKL